MLLLLARKYGLNVQSLTCHLENVAEVTSFNANKVGMKSFGELAGLLHDIGKATDEFQNYLNVSNKNSNIKGPDHSTAGAVWLWENLYDETLNFEKFTAQMLAIVILGHHGGLIDVYDDLGHSPYLKRMHKLQFDEQWQLQYEQVCQRMPELLDFNKLRLLFKNAVAEIKDFCLNVKNAGLNRDFAYGLMCKFLYSTLIDADRYDAACFEVGISLEKPKENIGLWLKLSKILDRKIDIMPKEGKINELRHEISKNCLENSKLEPGIYRLNCPTGSGKTLASLRYALNHSAEFDKERIFYVIPFLTIIEQNVLDVKKKLELDAEKADSVILELHSAKENVSAADDIYENTLQKSELLAERMEMPMIFTTMVRFLNTFFAKGTGNIRPLHQFANSVIIFDEVQAISPKHIAMFNEVINFLVKICGATVVLSTATQPTLDELPNNVANLLTAKNTELSACDTLMKQQFKRVELVDKTKNSMSVNDVANFLWQLADRNDNLLVILNTKSAVKSLYEQMCLTKTDDTEIIVLTTNLYPKHRKDKIEEVRQKLGCQKIIVISTQLIEAGVDLSFVCVVRSLAGLDSIIQGAGRCNRHGEKSLAQTYLINPDFENLNKLKEIANGKAVVEEILRLYELQPDALPDGLLSDKAIEIYFKRYYNKQSEKLKYPFKGENGTKHEMFDVLASNRLLKAEAKSNFSAYEAMPLAQSFKTASKKFKVIDEFGTPVVIAHGESCDMISSLTSSENIFEKYKILRKLQSYTVNISDLTFKELGSAINFLEDLGVYVLQEGYYNEVFGVDGKNTNLTFYCIG